MAKLDAHNSGTFKIGGDIEIYRLGFGAMRITSSASISSIPPIPMDQTYRNR